VRPAPPAASDTIVHLDLHPDNVILSPSGPVVIDWKNARRGDGAIDIAATWVIMATSEIDGALVQRTLADVMRRLFVAAFLRHVDRAAAVRQLPVMAHYRLLDRNLRPGERPAIRALLRREGV
jgi:aminoglycoside phosphotransferase (APT) family kinase protein